MESSLEDFCTQLAGLPDEAARAALLAASPHFIDGRIVQQLAEEVRIAVRVDIQRALHLAETALAIARQLASDHELALALRARANVDWFMGECKSAIVLFRQAAALFERNGNRNEVARTLSSSIQSHLLLGEYDAAFAAAAKAREIFLSLGESARVARVDINIANVYHRQNRYAEALKAYEDAYRQLLPHRDMEGIGVALHNMAVCLIALDDFEGALQTYKRVREFCSENEMPLLVAQADYNVAFLYYLRGDYTKALALLRSTRETCRKNNDTYHLGLCDLDQSEIYLELGLVEEAAEMAQASLAHFEQLGMGFESARSLTNLAIATNLQGGWQRSLELFARAGDIARNEDNRVWPNLIALYSALVLLEQNQFARAEALCLPAMDFFRSAQMPTKAVLCLLLLTRISLRSADLTRAALHCTEALRILENVDAPMLFYQARFLQGQIHESAGDPERAYLAYLESKTALETLRSSLQREELKIGLMRNRLKVYTRLVQLCLDRDSSESSSEEALSYVEAAKSRTLRDLILGGECASQFGPHRNEADRKMGALRRELNWYYHRIEREQLSQDTFSHENLQSLGRQAKTREHELLRMLLEAPDKAGVGLALQNSKTASLAEIRLALGANTALLEYFAIGNRTYVAVITGDHIRIRPLASNCIFAHRLRMLRFQFSKFSLNRNYADKFQDALLRATQDHLHVLHDELFAPISDDLPTIKNLVIVPFGHLHSLPFHALFDGVGYLIDRFNICYAPSASIFAHIQQLPENAQGPSLLLGVPDDRTPFIREELEAVAAVVPEPKLLFGPAATAEALREYGARSRMIHIASHGFFRQDSPMFSSIKLADSYLTLYDLYHMDLPVDLLTLSGCVTGLNVVEGGDELRGLTRGLLYSGAKSLLLSLWEVDDRSTSEFMRKFYGGFGNSHGKVDASRAAMLNLRERCPHPYFWAPFKFIGADVPVNIQSRS